jgi:hypothetical protein
MGFSISLLLQRVSTALNINQGLVEILGVLVAIGAVLIVFRWPWRAWGAALLAGCILSIGYLLYLAFVPYRSIGDQNFAMQIPTVLTYQTSDARELEYTDNHGSHLRFWYGTKTAAGVAGMKNLIARYADLKSDALKKARPGEALETDRPPTASSPYYVLSWVDSSNVDHYVCGRLKTIQGENYLAHYELLAPVNDNPFTHENYVQMKDTFLGKT